MEIRAEIHRELELRLARKLSANGSAAAAKYLTAEGLAELDGPEGHDIAVGAGWQLYLARNFGMLSPSFIDTGLLALQECLPGDDYLAEEAGSNESEEDQELDFRGFVSLDEDLVSDSGVQMLAAMLGSRETVTLGSPDPFGRIEVLVFADDPVGMIETFPRRRLIEGAGILKRFPDEVYRLALLSQAVLHYVDSCRTELARRAARRRFREVTTAAAELQHAAQAIGHARELVGKEDPSAPLTR